MILVFARQVYFIHDHMSHRQQLLVWHGPKRVYETRSHKVPVQPRKGPSAFRFSGIASSSMESNSYYLQKSDERRSSFVPSRRVRLSVEGRLTERANVGAFGRPTKTAGPRRLRLFVRPFVRPFVRRSVSSFVHSFPFSCCNYS